MIVKPPAKTRGIFTKHFRSLKGKANLHDRRQKQRSAEAVASKLEGRENDESRVI
jgi:hypothetical protein